jgi:V8-like Glu-specific endopeptidase
MQTTDPDSPVTNEPLSAAEALPLQQEPNEGPEPKAPTPNPDGSEGVPGYERISMESMGAPGGEIVFPESLDGLRDIGEASFGPLPPPPPEGVMEAIIGVDDRTRITDTTIYPYRAIASLLIVAADNSPWIGTGWFISPKTLVTAGHCVFIKNSGVPGRDGWVKSIKVIPGRNASVMPFGSAISNNFKSVTAWTMNGNANHDYGAIILNTPLGSTVGTFGFGVYSDADLLATTANVSGYPGDKPSGTQWFHARKVTSVNPLKVFYDIDTMGGQSGAPVWRIINGRRFAIAVHAYGGATANSGTRITAAVHANLVAWKA